MENCPFFELAKIPVVGSYHRPHLFALLLVLNEVYPAALRLQATSGSPPAVLAVSLIRFSFPGSPSLLVFFSPTRFTRMGCGYLGELRFESAETSSCKITFDRRHPDTMPMRNVFYLKTYLILEVAQRRRLHYSEKCT